MVNQQLIAYIKNQLAQGYNINSIKLNLARSGYSPEQIEAAVEAAYGKPTKHLVKMLLLIGGGAIVLAALITVLILLLTGGEEIEPTGPVLAKEVGLDILLGESVIQPGENLFFEVKVINQGSGSNFEVELKNEVFDSRGNKITEEEDGFNLVTQTRRNYEMELDLSEGSYQLKTTVEYNGQRKEKTESFQVSEEEVVIKELEALTGEGVKRIEDIKKVAETNYAEAKSLCLSLATVLEKDTCLLEVGLRVNKEEFCVGISDDDKRDSCYVNMALSLKNFNLCNQIVNQNLKGACLSLGG